MKPCKEITASIPVNVKIAEGQDEYQTLHAHYAPGPHGSICFAVELEDEEIEMLKKSKKLYVNLLTFNKPMQPIFITADPSIIEDVVEEYTREGIRHAN